jgi:choline dehydrogenase-like flavoprotein
MNFVVSSMADGLLEQEVGGTVALRDHGYGRLKFSYPLEREDFEAFLFAQKLLARIQLAAGAKQVLSAHEEPVSLGSVDEIDRLDSAPWEKLRLKVFTAHQMGGCNMGADPARSVVTPELRYRGLDNLFVVDGSVLPTALGVNPQETIFGLSHWGAAFVAQAV